VKRELAHRHPWTTPQKSARIAIFSEHIEAFYNSLGEFEQSVGATTEALAEGVTEGTQGVKGGGGRFYDEAFAPRIAGDYSLRLLLRLTTTCSRS
jgi:hypothetical protein